MAAPSPSKKARTLIATGVGVCSLLAFAVPAVTAMERNLADPGPALTLVGVDPVLAVPSVDGQLLTREEAPLSRNEDREPVHAVVVPAAPSAIAQPVANVAVTAHLTPTPTPTPSASKSGSTSRTGNSTSSSSSSSGTSPVRDSYGPCNKSSSIESGLTAQTKLVFRAVCANFSEVTSYGGYRSERGSYHGSGQAIDAMVGKAGGDRLANWLIANHDQLKVIEIIWQQRYWSAETGRWKTMSDRGSPTQNHMDHVHISVGR